MEDQKRVKDFIFCYGHQQISLSITISFPTDSCNYTDIGYSLIKKLDIPSYAKSDFLKALKEFIEAERDDIENEDYNIDVKNTDAFAIFDGIASQKISATYNDHSKNLTSFYHKFNVVIHSGLFTDSLIGLEYCFSLYVYDLIRCRNKAINEFSIIQNEIMDKTLDQVGISVNEEDINRLSLEQLNEVENIKRGWEESLRELKKKQKSEFEEWVTNIYDSIQKGLSEENRIIQLITKRIEQLMKDKDDYTEEKKKFKNSMDESFTINLGAQLKTTHNLRLTSKSITDIYNIYGSSSISPTAQRIQTAMNIYSNFLTGLILLVDDRVNSYNGSKKEFADVCEKSTDFHFPTLEEQLELVREKINLNKNVDNSASLLSGDFYVTRHSNLPNIHVAFHLVVDESVNSSDISSRHSVLLGLRNILKFAYLSDVSTILLPLFLSYEISDNMTLHWCLKRAELVFKCVKGFMIEMASLSPSTEDTRTLQFLVPEGVSEELFLNLATMLPSIFRLSNPLILSSSFDDFKL